MYIITYVGKYRGREQVRWTGGWLLGAVWTDGGLSRRLVHLRSGVRATTVQISSLSQSCPTTVQRLYNVARTPCKVAYKNNIYVCVSVCVCCVSTVLLWLSRGPKITPLSHKTNSFLKNITISTAFSLKQNRN